MRLNQKKKEPKPLLLGRKNEKINYFLRFEATAFLATATVAFFTGAFGATAAFTTGLAGTFFLAFAFGAGFATFVAGLETA